MTTPTYKPSCPISHVESTTEKLADRGGLILFSHYLLRCGILEILGNFFGRLRRSKKGLPIAQLFHQVLCFFADATNLAMTRFDELRQDDGYAAILECKKSQLASSHQAKRFFKSFAIWTWPVFRRILRRLFIWRLKIEKPTVIELMPDTVVLNNDEAKKRHGVDPTYKGVKGFQPLQVNWNGFTVEAIFRRGKTHSNYHNVAADVLVDLAKQIRAEYRPDVTIIVRCDAGFFDQVNFAAFDKADIAFVASGKLLPFVKKYVADHRFDNWQIYRNGNQTWDYLEFEYRCDSWERPYRAFYTVPEAADAHGQLKLEFERPENIILTNIGVKKEVLQHLSADEKERWLKPETIIACHHERGADELPHRALKDFGTESLSFLRFQHNAAFYYIMLIAFFLFEAFKRDVLPSVLPATCYATRVRRFLFDIAAKIVSKSRKLVLKIFDATIKRLEFFRLWELALQDPIVPL